MKNIIKVYILFILCSFFFSLTKAETGLIDWIDNLNDEIPFGYTLDQKITIKEITLQKVVIESPVIIDELGGKIKTYTVMYSEYPLDQMLSQTNLLNQSKEKTFTLTGNETIIDMELLLYDAINPNKVYYVLVMPKDAQGVGGQISNEIWFKLADQTYGEGALTGSAPPPMHAAGANMTLANLTHTCNPDCLVPSSSSKKITLKRISVAGSDSVDIFLNNDGTTNFNRIATVNMSAEQYELTTSKNGEHVFKFTPNNGGIETTYTINIAGIAQGTTAGPTTTIPKVPTTGPTENTIVAILITFIAYFAYRRLFRKH